MTYLDLIRDADRKLDKGDITLGEYEQMIAPLKREIQPERKRGHWRHVDPITEVTSPRGWMPWYCSECGTGVGKHQTTFCPNCGADMRKENES